MINTFFLNQDAISKKQYIDLLEITGSLSNLFAESSSPFLYYRTMENIFCKAFNAVNLARGDISADAGKNGVGIGLKTFLQNNGNTFQKIAEFNKNSYLFAGLTSIDLVKKVSLMRNERIKATMRICKLSDMMYHIVTRSYNRMAIYEEHMDFINIDKLKMINEKSTTIQFNDGLYDYNFNKSKSTLFKRFDTSDNKKIFDFPVSILEDPYEFLLSKNNFRNFKNEQKIHNIHNNDDNIEDFIVLPLYSPKTQIVENKSGLNQWNANGRIRNENEVYIPIPAWIHKFKNKFFEYNTDDKKTAPFKVQLPNGELLDMKVAQQGGKALMSNPNRDLGKWILRDILELEPRKIVTKEHLDIIGIDSVKLTKTKNGTFLLDFLKSGSFEEYKNKYIK